MTTQTPRTFDKRIATILLIVLVQMIGAAMILPILPLYAQRRFDIAPELNTLLISVFFLAQFLAGPTIGRLSDNYGRVPVLIISQIGTVISFLMIALAGSIEVILLARILDGITGGNIIVAQAYLTDILPRERRTQALGLVFAVFGLGFIIGPAAGGLLSAAFGDQMPFIFAALAALLTVILTWRTLSESLTPEQRAANRTQRGGLKPRQILQNRPLTLILLSAFGAQFGLGLLQSTFALFGDAVLFAGESEARVNLGIGLILAMVGLGQIIVQLALLQRLVVRFGEARLVLLGSGLRVLAMIGLAVAISPWLAAIAALFFSMGGGIMMPSLQSLSTNTVGDELRGGVLGVYQSVTSLAVIFSTAFGGVLFGILPALPYWVSAAIFLSVLLTGRHLLRLAPPPPAPASSEPELKPAAMD